MDNRKNKKNTAPKRVKQSLQRPGPAKVGGEPSSGLAKVTLYVRPEQIVAIEDIQLQERKRTGSRPDKSRLVQEALDLLAKKYGLKV